MSGMAVVPRGEAATPAVVGEVAPQIGFTELLALAKQLVPTGFMPDHIKTPGQAVAIILTGRELGMGPMRAIRSLQIVKGKVVENADSQLARFKASGGRAIWQELTAEKAILWLRHSNGDEHTEKFTMEDARLAGLAGQDNYKKHPKAMLRSRAITAGLKSIGWEGAVGAYDPEEAAAFPPNGEDQGASPEPSASAPPAATGPVLPFGNRKGIPLADMTVEELNRALDWAVKKDKYVEFQEEALAELTRRAGARPIDEVPAGLEDTKDELPF